MNRIKIISRRKTGAGTSWCLLAVVSFLLLAGTTTSKAQTGTVPVRDTDNPARQPFQIQLVNQTVNANTPIPIQLVNVPLGKRLVIEFATIGVLVFPTPEKQSLVQADLQTQINGVAADHVLTLTKTPELPASTAESFQATLPVRVYADPGTAVALRVVFTSNSKNSEVNQAIVNRFSISGYFVDLNQP